MRSSRYLRCLDRKKGSLGVNRMVLFVLFAFVALVLIGIFTEGFGSLRDQLANKFDELQFLKDSGIDGDCNERRESISGVASGVIITCTDSCTFDSDSETFLGASKFKISNDGFGAWMVESEKWENVDSWGNDLEESEKHRDAYRVLEKVFDGFYETRGNGNSREEFFEPMEFDSDAHFRITVVSNRDMEIIFDWNGERWLRTFGEYTSYETDDEKVFTEIYDSYKYGYDVYWNYKGDGALVVPISGFNVNFKDVDRTKGEFDLWLGQKVNEIDSGEDSVGFYVEIGDPWRNTVYFYKDNKWKKDGWWFDTKMEDEKVLDGIFEAHQERYEITWHYHKDERVFLPISNEEILSRSDLRSEEEFEKWFNDTQDNWTETKEDQEDLLEDFSWYLREYSVSFEGEEFYVKMLKTFEDERSKILIYFNSSSDGKFGVYLEEGELILAYGDTFKDSIVNDVLDFSDEEWRELVKVSEIYERLVKRCRK